MAQKSFRSARFGGVLIGLIMIVVAAACATDLGVSDPGVASEVNDINNAGWTVGTRATANGSTEAFVRSPEGDVKVLPGLTGATRVVADAINDDGVVVGWDASSTSAGGVGHERALRWDVSGRPTELPGLGGQTRAIDINDVGDIVGGSTSPSGSPDTLLGPTEPVFWDHADPQSPAVPLPELAGSSTRTWVTAINSAGLIVGYSSTNSEDNHALKWSPGTHTLVDLTPFSANCVPDFQALGVNDAGDIVGSRFILGFREFPPGQPDAFPGQAVLFPAGHPAGCDKDDGSTFVVLPGIVGVPNHSVAKAIAPDGTIVGQGVGNGQIHAVRWAPFTGSGAGALTDLGTLGGLWSSARSINDGNAIVGASTDRDGVVRATQF